MNDTSVKLCSLYQKQSDSGNTYFFGRWGNTKVLLFRDNKASEASEAAGKDPIWNLLIQECEYKPDEKPKLQKPTFPPPPQKGNGFEQAKQTVQRGFAPDGFGDRLPEGF